MPAEALTSGSLVIELAELPATTAFGRRLGSVLFPGAVVALIGQLGAGKTHLVRAIAEGLAIPNPKSVSSPTFVLIQEYTARLPIYHFDAYSLRTPADFFGPFVSSASAMSRGRAFGAAEPTRSDVLPFVKICTIDAVITATTKPIPARMATIHGPSVPGFSPGYIMWPLKATYVLNSTTTFKMGPASI